MVYVVELAVVEPLILRGDGAQAGPLSIEPGGVLNTIDGLGTRSWAWRCCSPRRCSRAGGSTGANLSAAVLLLRRHPGSPLASLATGLLLVAWVAIQTAIIGFRHWSQSIWWVTFVLITMLAARLVRQRTTPARGQVREGPLT